MFKTEDRQRMKEFWIKHSSGANIQEMLLDSNAEQISDNEMPEILSILPSFKGKKLLELGAGIGYISFQSLNSINFFRIQVV